MSAEVEMDAAIGLHETFDKVHDGATIIDTDKAALTIVVLRDGGARILSAYSSAQVAGLLEQLAAKLRARVTSADGVRS